MFSTDQFTIIFFKKAKRLATWEPFSFFNKMEKHNRVNSRTRTKRGGIFITAAFTLIQTPGLQKRHLKLKLNVLLTFIRNTLNQKSEKKRDKCFTRQVFRNYNKFAFTANHVKMGVFNFIVHRAGRKKHLTVFRLYYKGK